MVEKGYIYRGLKPIYWCINDETALAEAEIEYADHTSHSIFVRFPLVSDPNGLFATHQIGNVIQSSGPLRRGRSRRTWPWPFIRTMNTHSWMRMVTGIWSPRSSSADDDRRRQGEVLRRKDRQGPRARGNGLQAPDLSTATPILVACELCHAGRRDRRRSYRARARSRGLRDGRRNMASKC